MNEKTKNSSNIKTTTQDLKNSKLRNIDIIIEEIEKENQNNKKNKTKIIHNKNSLHKNNIKNNLPHNNNSHKKDSHLNSNNNRKKKCKILKNISKKNVIFQK